MSPRPALAAAPAATPASTPVAPPVDAAFKVLAVDPSLFTAPYDAALGAGLATAGVRVEWASRALRPGEEGDLDPAAHRLTCYRRSDGPNRRRGLAGRLVKGCEHALDLRRIVRLADARGYDLVHFQWAIMPIFDIPAMRRIARDRPVVLTVHDVTPFNGAAVNAWQRRGFDDLFGVVDHVIVHTAGARASLIARGADADAISVIAHGPLSLRHAARPMPGKSPDRWRVVLFGRLQTYKGIDVLIEALGRLPDAVRHRLEVVVAGDPLVDLAPLLRRADALGLTAPLLQIVPRRLDDQDMADLLGSADSFVFPYRAIEASGVLFLVAGLGRWVIASDLGAFADVIGHDGARGALVPPGDADALAAALADAVGRRPARDAQIPGWDAIGAQTAALYRRLLAKRARAA
ncbi:glycosyltransferase [Novosphingobium sp.]|uniref:glycosyltransferase n=1 Tax=Novosphingobium sp. TaxID=1874826 RepID=UPI0033407E7F